MKKVTIAILIAIMVIGFSSATYAAKGRGGQMGRGGKGGAHPLLTVPWEKIVDVADQVGISEDQLDALSELRSDFREANGDLKVDLKNKREDLKELMVTAKDSDKNAAINLVEEINALQGKVMKNSVSATFEIKKILSEEQLEHLKNLAEERMKERREERKSQRKRHGQRRGDRR